ncbi:MAG: NUDIX hydrolase [Candidatus Nanohaloarchaea archaeon]
MAVELAGNLIYQDGKLLLLYREDEGHWEIPGGKVKEGESPTEAAVREAEEEIGVTVSLDKPFFSGEFMHYDHMYLWHGYLTSIETGEPELREEKFSKMEWFEGSELDDLELAPNLRQILPALRKASI